jgi:demethylmenaquinone methyltransferase / 2-methoxy-6-polyprenyl-1,4-benzoquinol methylase
MVYDENTKTLLGELEGSTYPELSLINAMFEGTSSSYDSVVKLATLGMDHWWKRRLMRAIPPGRQYRRILDLACGTGISTLKIAEKFPQAEIVGIDITKSYLDVAAKKFNNRHVRNIELVHMPAEDMKELPGQFDLVIGSFVPKLVDLERLGSGCEAKLSPGGALVLHDFIVPTKKLLRLGF